MKYKPMADQPLGWACSMLGKGYLQLLNQKLKHLEIDRYYYTVLLIHANNGEINQQELAGLLETEKVSVSRIVDYLTMNGFVKKVTRTDDRRKHYLALTSKAVDSVQQIKEAIAATNEEVLAGISEEQRRVLTNVMGEVKMNLKRNNQNK